MPFIRCYPTATLRNFGERAEYGVASKPTLGLPHPWARLQSMSAVASRSTHRPRTLKSFRFSSSSEDNESERSLRPEGRRAGSSDLDTRPSRTKGGVQKTPSMRFSSFWRKLARVIVTMLVCLASTIRSQGFSPSQRFDPTRASWLYFTPHPPVGFRPSECFPLSQPLHLSMPRPLMPLSVTT